MAARLCPFCMRMAEGDTCTHCGKNVNYAGSPAHLPAGYVVSGRHPYVLGAALGQGGFGITYIALDMITNERVAIKEYYPSYCSTRTNNDTVTAYSSQEEVYQKGKERFLDEARTLKSLSDLKNIVNVLDFFEANNSAYLVMEFLDGSSLKEYVAENGKFPSQKFLEQIRPLMEDIERMHQRGVVHRDIAPDNIILSSDGQMNLIDFGSARSYVGDKSMTVVVKKGFAPVEQYLTKGTTSSTDVYALAATIYYCITGTVPMDSAERQYDEIPLQSPSSLGADITPLQEKALGRALAVQQKDRTQSIQAFLDDLWAKSEPSPVPIRKTQKEPNHKYVQKASDNDSKQSTNSNPKNATGRKKKNAVIISVAILAFIAAAGLYLGTGLAGEEKEKPDADITLSDVETTEIPTEAATLPVETTVVIVPTEPAIEEPVWIKNVLMADVTFDVDSEKFWQYEFTGYSYEIHNYFSKRPIFNTEIPRSKITDVFFLDSFSTAPETVFDVSANQDGSVLAWTEKNRKGALNLYIAGKGGVNGSEACHALFYGYKELESVQFNNCFFTDTTQDMSDMFGYCKKLTTIDLENLNTASVINMSSMFSSCDLLTSLDLGNFDTSNVRDMSSMFSNCPKLKSINLSSFDTSNARDLSHMFSSLDSMPSFEISHFDTSKVVNMSGMFWGCSNEKFTSLDLSNFDTSNVMNMSSMFYGCRWITELDLRNFNTSNVTNMQSMFSNCRRLTSLDLSSFDTSNVTNMQCMFEMCSMLPTLEISHFDTAKVTDMSYMFYKCGYLKKMDVTEFDISSIQYTTNMFYGCDKLPLVYKKLGGEYIWSS